MSAKTRHTIKKHKFTAKKKLGQNFLIDTHVLNKIITGSDIKDTDTIIEIGPGLGSLTERILDCAGRVIVIEKDESLVNILNETFAGNDKLTVIHADILKTDINDITKGRFKLISNLPYYIASAVIMRLLEGGYDIEGMTVMVQKEVGDRLTARPGSKAYGSLSVMARYYADISLLANVPPNAFLPRPKVDSAVLSITPREPEYKTDTAVLFPVIKAAFAYRRKTLANCLTAAGFGDKQFIEQVLHTNRLAPDIRGETLGLREFIGIADAFL